MVKVKSKFSIFVIRAQKDKGIVLFKNFDNTCKGFKMKQTSTTKKILVQLVARWLQYNIWKVNCGKDFEPSTNL